MSDLCHRRRRRIDDLRLAQLVGRLHNLGPRPTLELFREIIAAHNIGHDVVERLETYAVLDPEVVDALGGKTTQPPPLHKVDVAA